MSLAGFAARVADRNRRIEAEITGRYWVVYDPETGRYSGVVRADSAAAAVVLYAPCEGLAARQAEPCEVGSLVDA